ncbi:alpha/beta hydrolase [Nonomuraea sp. NPDC050556]|uniref:alpha/beta hydrolase n=1 Tax=Nonomuraea sp. NPDC050556 TaxID=3364369 RepID=UPI00378DCF47
MAGPARPVVWVDLTREDDAPEGAVHLHGRGISGLTWAIRHAVHRAERPCRRIPYGPHRDQWAELHLPDEAKGLLPVVALIHGGYWRSIWGADLMDALCADLAARGFAVWNLEYRRPDLHGWPATTADVAAGLDALSTVDAPLNLDKVAVVGHSAGGQLALRAAADGSRVALAVSLAGVLDLVEGERRWLSSGAVAAALGHATTPHEVHAGASPLLRLPMKVPQLIVQGSSDDLDLVDFGRRYARAAKEGGDTITYLEMSGDHFAVIDPRTPIWRTTALAIADALR